MDKEKISGFVLAIMLEYERFHKKEIVKLIAHTKEYKWSIHNILHEGIYAFTGEIIKPHEYDDIIDEWITRRYL